MINGPVDSGVRLAPNWGANWYGQTGGGYGINGRPSLGDQGCKRYAANSYQRSERDQLKLWGAG